MIRELYHFTDGVNNWYLTSADTAESYGGNTYSKAAIGRSDIERRGDAERASLTVTMGLFSTVGRYFLVNARDLLATLTIYAKNTDTGVTVQIWRGRFMSPKPKYNGIELIFESQISVIRRQGLRRQVQTSCPYVVYGNGCRVNPASFAVSGTASAISGAVVTVSAAALSQNGTYSGGMLQEPSGIKRYITKHAGSALTLSSTSPTLAVSDTVIIYPGCDQSLATCNSRFSNHLNYGGAPYRPSVNPFSGVSIV